MSQRLDLLKIAQEEEQGDLFKLLDSIYPRSKVQPRGISDAIIWEGGSPAGGVKPVAHAFTDKFALNGTLMALDVLGLPFLGVPMMAQFRHDTKLKSLDWFGKLDYTAIKWSTAGDALVNENGRKVVVLGKSANAPLRTAAGVYCNVRPYGTITNVRFMPGLPYSQDSKKFKVDRETGNIHSEMNTPGVRMAYAVRLFLKMVHDTGYIGRVATKPTQAQEDAVNAGILRWLLQGTQFQLKRSYAVDAYAEHKANVDAIARLSATVSTRMAPRAIRPVPSACVRHSTRSRKSTPTWKRPEPRPKTTRPVVSCGSWPTARIDADHATAPAVSTRPWSRKGRVGLVAVPGAAVATSERAGAGECWIVTVVTPVR